MENKNMFQTTKKTICATGTPLVQRQSACCGRAAEASLDATESMAKTKSTPHRAMTTSLDEVSPEIAPCRSIPSTCAPNSPHLSIQSKPFLSNPFEFSDPTAKQVPAAKPQQQ